MSKDKIRKFKIDESNTYGYDPVILLDRVNQSSHSTESYSAPFHLFVKDDDHFEALQSLALNNINDDEKDLEERALLKWRHPQGGFAPDSEKAELVAKYFKPDTNVHPDIVVDVLWRAATVLRSVVNPKELKSSIITNAVELFKSVSKTNGSSGMTCKAKKTEASYGYAIRKAMSNCFEFEPLIAQTVHKDSKTRIIFNDSYANFITECKYFSRMQHSIYNLESNAHYSDEQTAKMIVSMHPASGYASDVAGMDMNTHLNAVHAGFKLAGYIFGYTSDSVERSYLCIERLHQAPIIVGREMWLPDWEGTWQWLSGILPTHDIESLLLLLQKIETGLCLDLCYIPFGRRRLKENEFSVIVCGDDSIVLFGRDDKNMIHRYAQKDSEIASVLGWTIEQSKTEISNESIFYCKKRWSLKYNNQYFKNSKDNVPVAKYSCIKALNALYHPMNPPRKLTKRDQLYWFCSVMDNCVGMKNYKAIVRNLYEKNRQWFDDMPYEYFTEIELSQEYRTYSKSDFWFTYVGITLTFSHTLSLLLQYKLNS